MGRSRRGDRMYYPGDDDDDEVDAAAADERQEDDRKHHSSSSSRRSHRPPAAEPQPPNEVLGAFYNMLLQGAPPQEGGIEIDVQKASNVLEAAAGNLALAANLYWDDYFATQAVMQPNANENANDDERKEPPPAAAAAAQEEEDEDDNEDRKPAADWGTQGFEFARQLAKDMMEHQEKKRRLRRSLDRDFQAADDDEDTKQRKKAAKRARKSNEFLKRGAKHHHDDHDNEDHDEHNDGTAKRKHRNEESEADDGEEQYERPSRHHGRRSRHRDEPQRILAHDASETSISISDDEKVSALFSGRLRTFPADEDKFSHRPKSKHHGVSKLAVMKAVDEIQRKIDPNKTNLSKPSTWFLSPDDRGKRRRNLRDSDNEDRHCDGCDDSIDSNPEDYISDDDWLEGDANYPTASLWGLPSIVDRGGAAAPALRPPQPAIAAANDDNDDDDNNDDDNDGNNNDADNDDIRGNGNVVVADDEAMNVSGGEDDASNANKPESNVVTGMPHTWLNAGFQLSDCGSGLVIKSPTVDDIPFFAWRRQQEDNDQRNAVPPPYYCKSLTAITSIVTALLYTGASIEGNEADCTSGRKPWGSLTADERKREFEVRLADALSALIVIAAKASQKRKQKAYKKAARVSKKTTADPTNVYSDLLKEAIAATNKNDVNDQVIKKESSAIVEEPTAEPSKSESLASPKKPTPMSREWMEHMRRHIDLIPTCTWADSKTALNPRAGDGNSYNGKVRIRTSWTNIRDISLYVRSNMRAFTDKGGIALLLETIVRIHGAKVVARQLSRCAAAVSGTTTKCTSDKENEISAASMVVPVEDDKVDLSSSSSPKSSTCCLIGCTCEERLKQKNEENPLPLNVRNDPYKLLDVTPVGTECASLELLTLLLTGCAHSDWKDCSTEGLGIGLLSGSYQDVSQAMARPKRPVWLVQGETCFSVLTVESHWKSGKASAVTGNDDLKTISKVDQPGVSLLLLHWNGWYGQRGKTEMRLVASHHTNSIPSKQRLAVQAQRKFRSNKKGSKTASSLLVEHRRHEHLVNTVSTKEHNFTQTREIQDPIDPRELEGIQTCEEDKKLYPDNYKMWRFSMNDKQNATEHWIPYFRLTSRQKRLVETKLGPKINTILWTRWPGASIDYFSPNDGEYPVV